ncbi:TetR family transcriptional regulator [Kocuria koreensis]|jgi:AcrR family transcriptional regulator|uniref:TetR family transcriptional regulator n=2 Tax=Rothia koreensis TaxID=592378 RepID=A0A7K1LJL5_9MICC|nr:TetR family transcriptional regulator [Rothia koreensis]
MVEVMSAKSRVLDAYESILIAEGERAATMDAVAARADVSKGGLLYHFKDKTSLAEGLIERLLEYAAEDNAAMRASPEGPSRYYVRTSAFYLDQESGQAAAIDRTFVAVLSLGQDAQPKAREAMSRIHADWYDIILEEVGQPAIASAILLIGDGLYYNAALAGGGVEGVLDAIPEGTNFGISTVSPQGLEDLLEIVDALKGTSTS